MALKRTLLHFGFGGAGLTSGQRAQWIRLRLPFCHPGLESQNKQHLHFFLNIYFNGSLKRTKKEQKEVGNGP